MIDVIRLTHTVLKADVVADYRENIFERQMMRDKFLAVLGQKSLKRGGLVFGVFGFFNNFTQDRGVNRFFDAKQFKVERIDNLRAEKARQIFVRSDAFVADDAKLVLKGRHGIADSLNRIHIDGIDAGLLD